MSIDHRLRFITGPHHSSSTHWYRSFIHKIDFAACTTVKSETGPSASFTAALRNSHWHRPKILRPDVGYHLGRFAKLHVIILFLHPAHPVCLHFRADPPRSYRAWSSYSYRARCVLLLRVRQSMLRSEHGPRFLLSSVLHIDRTKSEHRPGGWNEKANLSLEPKLKNPLGV